MEKLKRFMPVIVMLAILLGSSTVAIATIMTSASEERSPDARCTSCAAKFYLNQKEKQELEENAQ